MDKEILNKFLTEMGHTLQQTKDFTLDQAPKVAKEILNYTLYEDLLLIFVGLIILFLGFRVYKYCIRKDKQDPYSGWGISAIAVPCILLIIAAPFILCSLYE